MGHNLNFNENTGRYSFFSVQQKAWHGLGQIVSDYPTSEEAIKQAGLDYEVLKKPVVIKDVGALTAQDGTPISGTDIEIPERFGTYRSDTCQAFDVVGRDYQIVQNREAFSFFDAIVGGNDGILYETAGALGRGERIFITAKLPDYIRVGSGDDVTEKYLFLTTSHDGSGSITAAFTPVRIVCQNTLNASLRQMSNVVRIRHTSGARQRLENAHKVMGLADKFGSRLEDIFNHWAKVKVSDAELRKILEVALCPNQAALENLKKGNADENSAIFRNTVEDAFAYAMVSESQQMQTTKGTLFGAYNAVTGYFQNVRKYKNEEAKLQNIVLGGTAQAKGQKAFDLCAGFAQNGNAILN